MKTLFRVRGYVAISEQDDYKNGCIGKPLQETRDETWMLHAPGFDELLAMLAVEFGKGAFLLNSCDEMGRLDLQVYQSSAFVCKAVAPATRAKWIDGSRLLWFTTYTFQVEMIATELDLSTYTKHTIRDGNVVTL